MVLCFSSYPSVHRHNLLLWCCHCRHQDCERAIISSTALSKNLPKSATFYLTYFVIQGIGSAAKNVINYSDLFEYLFYDYVFDRTPREKYVRRSKMKGIGWCSVYPKFANLTVIGECQLVFGCAILTSQSHRIFMHCSARSGVRSCWNIPILS